MKILLLTGYDEKFAPIGRLAERAMLAYSGQHRHIHVAKHCVSANYSRHPSWAKIGVIRMWLDDYDYVQWMDADALIVGKQDLADILKPATLNISRDHNGINCGVMAWRNCPQSFAALRRMEEAYPRFADHPWFEQAALMEFVDELDVYEQPKVVYNAYPKERTADSLIVHWAGEPNETRLREMTELSNTLCSV